MKNRTRTVLLSFVIATTAAAAAPQADRGGRPSAGFARTAEAGLAPADASVPPSLPEPWTWTATAPTAGASVGYLPGGSAVTPTGAYTYTIPLDVPPGRAGMAPALSLQYSSGTGNGPLGVGWQLAGLSRITRCGRTLASDGFADGVDFDATDAYCLDGAQLVQVEDGTWRTEADTFARIVPSGDTGAGPLVFHVWSKSGTVRTYERRTAKRVKQVEGVAVAEPDVRLAWVLTQVQDRSGNFMEIAYTTEADTAEAEAETLPLEIRYTRHAQGEAGQTQAHRVVKFVYELGRPDPGVLWQGGVKHARARRLAAIEMHAPNPTQTALAWRYELAYATSAGSGRSLLTSVKKCGAAGGCLWARQFDWAQSRGVNFREVEVLEAQGAVNRGSGALPAMHVLDADGDGADDLLFQPAGPTTATLSLLRTMRLPDGTVLPLADREVVNDGSAKYTGSALNDRLIDLDRDGRTELCHGRWAYHWDTATRELVKVYPPAAPTGALPWACSEKYELIEHNTEYWIDRLIDVGGEQPPVFADLDGDGRPDRIVAVDVDDDPEATDFRWMVQLNAATGWLPKKSTGLKADCPARITDLDGDGRAEFLTTTGWTQAGGSCTAKRHEVQLADDGTTLDVRTEAPNPFLGYLPPRLGEHDLLADLNGDGLEDIVHLSPTDATAAGVVWNTGNGYGSAQAITVPHDLTLDGLPLRNSGVRVADLNRDGRDDLVVFRSGGTGQIQTHLSQGNGTFTTVTLPYPSGVPERPRAGMTRAPGWTLAQLGDFNGDGRTDIAHIVNIAGEDHLRLLEQQEDYADLLTDVKDEATDWPREQITWGTRFADKPDLATAGCGYPVLCSNRAYPVVREVATRAHLADPADPTTAPAYRLQYAYGRPAADLGGRGSLGFAWTRTFDPQSGQETLTTYDHLQRAVLDGPTYQYPYAHRPATVTTVIPLQTPGQIAARPLVAPARLTHHVTSYVLQRTHGDRTHVVHPHAWYRKEWEQTVRYDWTATSPNNPTYGHTYDWQEPAADAVLRLRDGTWDFDDYGNLRLSAAITEHGGRETYTETTWHNDPTTWQIGLPLHHRVKHTQNGASVEQTTDTTYDPLGRPVRIDHNRDHPDPRVRRSVTTAWNPWGQPTAFTHSAPQGTGSVERHTRLEYAPSVPGAPDEKIYPSQLWSPDAPAGLQPSHWVLTDPAHGHPLATMDPNGVQTATAWDDLGRPVQSQSDGSLPVTRAYKGRIDTAGGHNGLVIHTTAGPQRLVVQTDALGRPLVTSHTGFDGTLVHQRHGYDPLGRPHTRTRPYQTGDLIRIAATWEHDILGRPLTVTTPDPSGDRLLTTRYDHQYDRTTVTDPKGHRQRHEYDHDGRLVRQIDLADDGTEHPTVHQWGLLGIDRTTGPTGAVTERTHDLLGRVLQETDPDTGTTQATYNGLGDLLQSQHVQTGDTTAYTYDPQGRLTRIDSPDGPTEYHYDTAPNGIGRLASTHSPDQIETHHAYDPAGRPTALDYRLPGPDGKTPVAYRIDRTWRPDGLPDQLQYPTDRGPDDRVTVQHLYNDAGYLTALDDVTTDTPHRLWQAHERRPDGSLARGTLADGAIDLQQRTSPHTGHLERLLAKTATSPTWDRQDLTYAYDGNGLVQTRSDALAQRQEGFVYDHLDRLTEWHLGYQETARTTAYGYDPTGNLTTVHRDGAQTEHLTYGNYLHGQPHAAATHTRDGAMDLHTYDPQGRLVHTAYGADDTTRHIDYNQLDLPTRLTRHHQTWTFAYDAYGQRLLKDGPDGRTVTLAGFYEHRRPSDGPEQHVFHIPTPDHATVQITRTATTTTTDYHLTDLLGSASLILDAQGNETQRLYYEPFGDRIQADGSPLQTPTGRLRQGFTGHDHEPELGLINMKGRMYDPGLRRFLSPDPYIGPGSQGLNPYSYVRNDPINFTDPSGYQPCYTTSPTCNGSIQNQSVGPTGGYEEWKAPTEISPPSPGYNSSWGNPVEVPTGGPGNPSGEAVYRYGAVERADGGGNGTGGGHPRPGAGHQQDKDYREMGVVAEAAAYRENLQPTPDGHWPALPSAALTVAACQLVGAGVAAVTNYVAGCMGAGTGTAAVAKSTERYWAQPLHRIATRYPFRIISIGKDDLLHPPLGFQAMEPTTENLQRLAQGDGRIRFIVDAATGALRLGPTRFNGQDILHFHLSSGRIVIAAGEAQLGIRSGQVVGTWISNDAGNAYITHFRSLGLAGLKFSEAGIVFGEYQSVQMEQALRLPVW